MTFLHRLANRIARLKAPLITLTAAALGCSQGERADFLSPVPGQTTTQLKSIQISPKVASVQAGQEFRFSALTLTTAGAVVSAAVDWSAESGTISSDGRFVGLVAGPIRVAVRAHDRPDLFDTAVIAVWQNETDPTGITVQPAEISLEEGDSLTFSAFLNLANGVQAAGAMVDWSTTGGQITSSGYYVAPTAGEYYVSATTGNGYTGTALVRVRRRAAIVSAVTVSPKTGRIAPGQGIQFSASTIFSDGKTVPASYSWSTSGGSVTQNGAYQAPVTEGTYQVVVVGLSNLADTAVVTVARLAPSLASLRVSPEATSLPAAGQQQFTVTGTMSDGSPSQPLVTWSSTGGSVSASGLYKAGSVAGPYRVIATQQGGTLADTAEVTIQPPAVVALAVSPGSVAVPPGGSQQFSASATWSNGSTTLPALTWSATGGAVSSTGHYTAGNVGGTYNVTVTGGGLSDAATVSVGAPVVLVSLNVSPKPAQLTTGGSLQFSVNALWSDGSSALPAISWSATGGTINSNGVYNAGSSAGTYRVIASGGGRADSAEVVLTAPSSSPTLTGISVSPKSVSIYTGSTQQFIATGIWSGGTGTMPSITWSSTGGSVNSNGLYTAGTVPGTYRVVATGGGKADTSAVTVAAPPNPSASGLSLTLNPKTITLPVGEGQFFMVTAQQNGTSVAPPVLAWSATGGSVSSLQTGGFFTPPSGAGTYRVMVSGNGAADTATVTIQAGAPAPTLNSLSITPKTVSLSSGTSQQFLVAANWSDGSTAVPPLTWSSTGGSVTSSGYYTAGSIAGTFRVMVSGGGKADTATVNLTTTPVVTQFSISPKAVSLSGGGTQQFQSTTIWSDGVSRSVTVTYSATGGTVSVGGLFTAAQIAGTFSVIASCSCGRADTANVTINGSVPATLSSLSLWPDSTSVNPGGTAQFQAFALWSNGSSTLPSLSWSATGGTVSQSGLYTAGNNTGSYRVIVSGGGKADTAAVTVSNISSPPPSSSGLYPNKPGNYVPVTEINFSQNVPASDGTITGGNGWNAYDVGHLSKVTSDGPESPTGAWRFTIPNESWPSGGRGFGKVESPSAPGGKAGYYFNWKVKLDANYLPHPYGEKFAAGFGSNGWLIDLKGFDWFTVFCYGCSQAQVPNWPALAVLDHNSPPLGQWLNVELLYEPGSSGRIRLWINGNLHVNFQGSVPALSGSSEHYIFQGGDGMTRDRVSWRDYDHISIWTAP